MNPVRPTPTSKTTPISPVTPRYDSQPSKPGMDRHLWEIRPIRDLFIFSTMAAFVWFLYELSSVFLPIFIALVFAYLVDPFVDHSFTHWSLPRPVTVGVLMFLLVLASIGIGLWFVPLLIEQTQTLIQKIPVYAHSISERYETWFSSWSFSIGDLLGRLNSDPLATLQPILLGTGHAFGLLGQVLGVTVNLALYTVLIPIYVFFFAWHFQNMSRTVARLIPLTHRPHLLHVFHRMDTAVRGFFFERLLITVITAILYAIGWALTDVPYWFLLGVATGLASLVPYLSAIGWPLAVLLKYADAVTAGQSVEAGWMAIVIWPSIAYLVVQFIESWILTPWLQSHSTEMSAVTILIVVFVGGAVGGLFGLIFAIPVAACIKIAVEEFVRPRWLQWVRDA